MKALYINRVDSKLSIMLEGIYFYYLYLFTEKSEFNSMLPFTYETWKRKDTWSNKFIIDLMCSLVKDDPEGTRKEMLGNLKTLYEIKNLKHKTQHDVQLMSRLLNLFSHCRKYVAESLEAVMKMVNFWNLIDLLKDDTVQLNNYARYDDRPYEDNIASDVLDFIIKKEGFLILDSQIRKYMKEVPLEEGAEQEWLFGKVEFYSFPLFSMPYGRKFTKENMRVLHRNLLGKTDIITSLLDDFKEALGYEVFNEEMKDDLLTFYDTLKPELDNYQKHIDSQMYFQQAINSDKDCFTAQIRVGVCSAKNLVEYFWKSRIMNALDKHKLSKKFAKQTDLKKCEAFLYIEIPDNILL